MDKTKIEDLEIKIKSASPLELAKCLEEAELWDQKETRAVIDEIYASLSNGDDFKEQVVIPIFTSIADGLLECSSATRKLRKKGLTATRIVAECRSFSYDKPGENGIMPDGYTEWKNVGEQTRNDFKQYGEEVRQGYSRNVYENKERLNEYKQNKFDNNGGRINAIDEYTGEKNVYQYRSNPDARRNVEKYKHDHQAEVDHIVPLKQIHEQLKGNYALTDDDIKSIANSDYNYALTSARTNRGAGAPGQGGKFDMTNTEFVADQRRREQEGLPYLGISEESKEHMIQMEKDAIEAIEHDANKAIYKNLTGQGTGNSKEILSQVGVNAANQSKDYMVGNLIMYLIKPLYYEVSDIITNGLEKGVGVNSTKQALKIRFTRVKDYLWSNAKSFIGDNVGEFIKNLISSIVEGIISMFLGIFKQILKLIKEGIKVFIKAGKVLFGEESMNMSAAEKGDAILKIIGGSVVAICGIGLEALLNKIGIGEPWSVMLSTILSGIASALFMYSLDKLDLFSVKAEKRYARIEDIFNERIKDIKQAKESFNNAALEVMRQQRLQFASIENRLKNAINADNIDEINKELFSLASFFKVDLPYKSTTEFLDFMDSQESISL